MIGWRKEQDMKKVNVGILGATGAVGREMIKILEERDFPLTRKFRWRFLKLTRRM